MDKRYKILILEDDYFRIKHFKKRLIGKFEVLDIVDKASDCIKKLSKNKYDLIFLDHDLDNDQFVPTKHSNTGSEVARWFLENPKNENWNSTIILHSLNPTGRKFMKSSIPNSFEIPFVWKEEIFNGRVHL